jgi:hypothetical protein
MPVGQLLIHHPPSLTRPARPPPNLRNPLIDKGMLLPAPHTGHEDHSISAALSPTAASGTWNRVRRVRSSCERLSVTAA